MANYYSYYTLQKEEKETIKKTCEILSKLEGNNSLNAHLNFSLVKELLELILTNENNPMTF